MTTIEPNPDEHWGALESWHLAQAPADLADQVRTVLDRHPELPSCWAIGNGRFDAKYGHPMSNLQFGITAAENTGVLSWYDDDDRRYRPAAGINAEEVEYRMAGVHTTYFEIGMVVPADVVYAAVEEYLRTHERPTCLDWVAVNAGQ
jgi:hypothetical protein